jgi:hypothetical protein
MNSKRISTNFKVKQRMLTMKKEIHEIKKATQAMKEEFTKDMENQRKKKQKTWK